MKAAIQSGRFCPGSGSNPSSEEGRMAPLASGTSDVKTKVGAANGVQSTWTLIALTGPRELVRYPGNHGYRQKAYAEILSQMIVNAFDANAMGSAPHAQSVRSCLFPTDAKRSINGLSSLLNTALQIVGFSCHSTDAP